MAIQLNLKHVNDILVLYVSGQIIGKDSNKFGAVLQEAVKLSSTNVVVDLSEVQFLDSLSIGAIIVEHAFLAKQEPPKVLMIVNHNIHPFDYVGRILKFLSVDTIVPVYSFFEEAIGSQFNQEIKKIQKNIDKRRRFIEDPPHSV